MSARARLAVSVAAAVFFSLPGSMPALGKSRGGEAGIAARSSHRQGSPAHLEELQAALVPFLTARAEHRGTVGAIRYPSTKVYFPTDADLFALARHWDELDESFRELYARALYIPADFRAHVSPSDRFEVYYTKRGADAVNTTDQYGFSAANWRNRTVGANGVPDYVDEVAWALDSAWSMIVDRFGFRAPIGYVDGAHTSGRYKLVLREMNQNYGYTYPDARTGDGFASYIEIENDWAESWWAVEPTDYRDRPYDAAYITCAHELFHGSQYAMAHSTLHYIDDYPVGWLEGTAVMMEELGFDYVNDYVQYAVDFFTRHTDRILDPRASGMDISVYKNSLFALYVYQRSRPEPAIDFVRAVHYNRYRTKQPFHTNILAGAAEVQRDWPELLGSFFTGSYFTGSRADTSLFIRDAERLGQWSVLTDIPDSNQAKTKRVYPYAMNTFSFKPSPDHGDTRYVTVLCPDHGAAGELDVRLILERSPSGVEVVPVALENGLFGAHKIERWHEHERLIVVATNGGDSVSREVTVFFADTLIDTLPPPQRPDTSDSTDTPADTTSPAVLAVYPNPVSRRDNGTVSFECEDLLEVTLYTAEGLKIRRAIVDREATEEGAMRRFRWDLRNERGGSVLPGTYLALIGREDPRTKGIRYERTKVMVVP